MNILMVIYSPLGLGGAEVSTLSLAEELQKRGHAVYIASTEGYPRITTLRFSKYRKIPLYSIHNLYLKNFLTMTIRKKKIDIVHAQDRLTSVPAILAAEMCNIPCVVHFRDYWFACPKSSCLRKDFKECTACKIIDITKCSNTWYRIPWDVRKSLYLRKCRKILNRADAKIAVSTAVKQKLKELRIHDNIKVIHNGRHAPPRLKQSKKDGTEINIVFFGSFFETKGIRNIIQVMKNIVETNSNVRFTMVGDGPLYNEVQQFIRHYNLNQFSTLGKLRHEEVWEVYQSADIVVLPSIWAEPFSGVILETMFSGKPIVASNKGGMLDVISDGQTGFLVNPLDLRQWEQQIQTLIDSQELRENMGRNALVRAKEFTPEKIAEQTELVYSDVVRKRGGTAP